MSAKTKIVVLKMKELIYTCIFVALGIILIILLVIMFFSNKNKDKVKTTSLYIPGVYTSSINLNNQSIDVEVTVDSNHINSIRFVHLDEAIATMYPLMNSTMDSLATQICEKQSLDNISYSNETQYTSQVLLKSIKTCIDKARIPDN